MGFLDRLHRLARQVGYARFLPILPADPKEGKGEEEKTVGSNLHGRKKKEEKKRKRKKLWPVGSLSQGAETVLGCRGSPGRVAQRRGKGGEKKKKGKKTHALLRSRKGRRRGGENSPPGTSGLATRSSIGARVFRRGGEGNEGERVDYYYTYLLGRRERKKWRAFLCGSRSNRLKEEEKKGSSVISGERRKKGKNGTTASM